MMKRLLIGVLLLMVTGSVRAQFGFGRPDAGPAPAGEKGRDNPREATWSEDAGRKAVEKSLPLLMKAAKGHSDSRTCFTCHNHGTPMLAMAVAKERGFDVPEKRLQELVQHTTEFLERNKERFLKGQGPGPAPEAGGETDTTSYAFFALEMAGKEPDEFTAATVTYTLLKDRNRDFWWVPLGIRPPSEGGQFTTTALSIRGLKKYGSAEQKEQIDKRIKAARGWLIRTPAKDNEDRVFRLAGLRAAGATDDEMREAFHELINSQRGNGGWSQLDDLDCDAYATGSALWALHDAGMKTDHGVYRKGLEFLLGTQRDDGTWYVPTRSRPVQKYFETGYPYARDQFISCAGSGWATTALALACPKK
jgi:hypothetical protein